MGGSRPPGAREDRKDTPSQHDAAFTHDIEINDLRNRYLLTKGATQAQVRSQGSELVVSRSTLIAERLDMYQDRRRDGRFYRYEGYLAAGQVQGDSTRASSIPSHRCVEPGTARQSRWKSEPPRPRDALEMHGVRADPPPRPSPLLIRSTN
jgi:hypothetical protein